MTAGIAAKMATLEHAKTIKQTAGCFQDNMAERRSADIRASVLLDRMPVSDCVTVFTLKSESTSA